MPERIEISDTDVDEIEKLFGDLSFDGQHRQVIKCLDNNDIQAFPGSGKTTSLVAKLAILAKKWPYSNRGICVLSHTNAARTEIENRLGNTEIGRHLLSYPHFIGTFHSFFDTFVALPWLRSNGYPITMIDTDKVLERRYRRLKWATTKYMENRGLSASACEATSFPIEIDLKCSKEAQSYKDVLECVNKSFLDGYFTFNEMLYIAKHAIRSINALPKTIQLRFPFLFIDEAQDTSEFQLELINSCFCDPLLSVTQAFGDANQAIFQTYSSTSTSRFPRGEYLTISNSHRFGESIAKLVDPIGIAIQGLSGSYRQYDHLSNKHTIFLFDNDTSKVLPAYAEHLLSCFSNQELVDQAHLGCYAVGMVHRVEQSTPTDRKYPISVKDYWANYNPDKLKSNYSPTHLIEYIRMGHRAKELSGNYCDLVEFASDAFRRLIRFRTSNSLPSSGSAFCTLSKMLTDENKTRFRVDFLNMLQMPISNETEWASVLDAVWSILTCYFGVDRFENRFFQWLNDTPVNAEDVDAAATQNTFVYTSPRSGRSVTIHLSSIHAVKGKTHLATLVLDTFWHKRNMQSIMPWLCNTPPAENNELRNVMRLKCQYVALSRARGLVCMAMPKAVLSQNDRISLSSLGWNIVDL